MYVCLAWFMCCFAMRVCLRFSVRVFVYCLLDLCLFDGLSVGVVLRVIVFSCCFCDLLLCRYVCLRGCVLVSLLFV